jgi:hypothetical protein
LSIENRDREIIGNEMKVNSYPFKTAIADFIYQQIILLFLRQTEAQFPV